MGAGMWVDRSGAVEIAQAAKEFEWTWTRSDVERFVAEIDRPRARISGADGRVDYLVVTVAALSEADDELGPALGAAFHQVRIRVTGRGPSWTRSSTPSAGKRTPRSRPNTVRCGPDRGPRPCGWAPPTRTIDATASVSSA